MEQRKRLSDRYLPDSRISIKRIWIILGLYIEIEQNNMMCGVNTCLFMQVQKVIL